MVLVGLVTAIGVYGQIRRSHREAARRAAVQAVLDSHSPLQKDAARIDSERRTGNVMHFALVPKTQPPGLIGMAPSGFDPIDVYSFSGLKAVVRFTGWPPAHPCGTEACVRLGPIDATSSDIPGMRQVAVRLSGTRSVDDTEIREFWAKTAWVPITEADWYIKLAVDGQSRI